MNEGIIGIDMDTINSNASNANIIQSEDSSSSEDDETQDLLTADTFNTSRRYFFRPRKTDRIPEDESVESLDYDEIENSLYRTELEQQSERHETKYNILYWLIILAIGFITGVVAFVVDISVFGIVSLKYYIVNHLIDTCDDCIAAPLVTYCAINVFLVLIAALLVAFVEPAAGGSGVPQLKCYLNGIRIPRLVRMKTFTAKIVGVLCSLSGGLIIGKAAPMIHSGAIIAAGVSQGQSLSLLPGHTLKTFRYFRNDRDKRDFIAAGAAAGVAATFGAPLGGLLFSLEDGASFWKQGLTWRTFFCAVVSAFTLNFFLSGIYGDGWGNLSQSGLINFGSFDEQNGYNIYQFPLFVIVGVFGGLIGALFIRLSLQLTRFRSRWNHNKLYRILEVVAIAILTSCVCFLAAYMLKDCKTKKDSDDDSRFSDFQFYCAENEYNQAANLFFTTQETTIKQLLHGDEDYSYTLLLSFSGIFFLLALITNGIAVPSGLFVPAIVIGCASGRVFGQMLRYLFPLLKIQPGTFALLGSAAMLGGIFRTPISLTAILIETTNDVVYGLPLMITLMVSKWIGDFFDDGIYNMVYKVVRFPFLGWDAPPWMRKHAVKDVMVTNVVTLQPIETVDRVVHILKTTTHNGFPVVNEDGLFCGVILRSQLTVLLKLHAGLDPHTLRPIKSSPNISLDTFRKYFPRFPEITNIKLDEDETKAVLDMGPYMNPHPYTVTVDSSLARAFRLFRTMGLRHLCVVTENNKLVGMVTRKDLSYVSESSLLDKQAQSMKLHNLVES